MKQTINTTYTGVMRTKEGCPTCGSKERGNDYCSYACLVKAGKATPSTHDEWGNGPS